MAGSYVTIGYMAKGKSSVFDVQCPCCQATLQVDPELKVVLHHKEHKKPPMIEDMAEAVKKLKGEEARRGEVFDKSFEDHRNHQKILNRKFDELLKQAKDDPSGSPPPKRPFDFD